MHQGDIRDAAEKAWCATKRATDALILARTGVLPERSPVTTRELHRSALENRRLDLLMRIYHVNQDFLHGHCFYMGLCEPVEDTERLIGKHWISSMRLRL